MSIHNEVGSKKCLKTYYIEKNIRKIETFNVINLNSLV